MIADPALLGRYGSTAFAQRTGRRFGTAANVERIMPVEYSPVISSTPSTPRASTPKLTPTKLVESGSNSALSAGAMDVQRDAVTALARAPKPIVTIAVTKSV